MYSETTRDRTPFGVIVNNSIHCLNNKIMKKFLVLLAFAGFSLGGFAQDATPTEKYSVATNSFWSNWFIQAGADWNAWYSNEERGHGMAKSPLKKFRSNPGVSLAIGKWFTPGIGLRTKVQGIWGKYIDADWDDKTNEGNGNKYWIANEQVMLNLSNLFCGYNESRVWNVVPFVGAGVGRSMTYNSYAIGLSLGVQSTWKVSKHLNVYLEAGWNHYEPNIDGGDAAGCKGWVAHDNNVYGEVGLTFNIGKATWKKVPDMEVVNALHQSELDALNARLNDAEAENERLSNQLKEQKPVESKTQVVKEVAAAPVSVFFNLNKANIPSSYNLVNVKALAKLAKENGSKLVVTGFADNSTGKAAYNQKLSEKRAQAVADALVKMGVDKNNITVKANGGVNELDPVSYNRRAIIELAK